MTAPNPVRMLPSHGVVDQTAEDWKPCEEAAHWMISVKTGSPKVPYVERCRDCGLIDASSLEWWADNAIKMSLSARAGRMAVATETEPFAFVQSECEELQLIEVLGQALGAASVCWVGGTGPLEFDGTRAKSVFTALLAEVERFQRLALEDAATRAVDYLRAHSGLTIESDYSNIRKAIEEGS
jgi:hypothetical protein